MPYNIKAVGKKVEKGNGMKIPGKKIKMGIGKNIKV